MGEGTALKRCNRCATPKPLSDFYRAQKQPDGHRNACKECERRTPEQAERQRQTEHLWRAGNPDNARSRRIKLRESIFEHYGRACACCGTANDLTIDHVNGGGAEHRAGLSNGRRGGWLFYRWLAQNGFPAGYQVLCRPCNGSKRHAPKCVLDHGTRE